MADETQWRFNSGELPWRLQQFVNGERRDQEPGGDPAAELAAKFGLSREPVAEAMRVLPPTA